MARTLKFLAQLAQTRKPTSGKSLPKFQNVLDAFFSAARMGGVPSLGASINSRTIPTGATSCFSTNTSMATTVLVLVQAIKPVGLVSLQNSWSRAVSNQENRRLSANRRQSAWQASQNR